MKLYDVYDNGKYIGAFTTNEASKIIGYKEPRYISSKAGTGKLAFNRFLIEKTGDFTLLRKKDQKLLEDFDYITGIIKNV